MQCSPDSSPDLLPESAPDSPHAQRAHTLLKALAQNFYEIVPAELETYCAVTSRISQRVLSHFDIESRLTPCQAWLATQKGNFVVGFLGHPPRAGVWDGHVTCCTDHWLLDTALSHFKREFKIEAPKVALAPRFRVNTLLIARADLGVSDRLWWIPPPPGATAVPMEPEDVVKRHADRLIERLESLQAP